MRRLLTWIAAGVGVAALLRRLHRHKSYEAPASDAVWDDAGPDAAGSDPAAELRRKLAESRGAGDDRDEFDAAEGTPVDEVEPYRATLEERRAAIHAKAQEALGEMDGPNQP